MIYEYEAFCEVCGRVTEHDLGSCLPCHGGGGRVGGGRFGRSGHQRQDAPSQRPDPEHQSNRPEGRGSARAPQSQGKPQASGSGLQRPSGSRLRPAHTHASHAAASGAHVGRGDPPAGPRGKRLEVSEYIQAPQAFARVGESRAERGRRGATPSCAGSPAGSKPGFGSLDEARSLAWKPSRAASRRGPLPARSATAKWKGGPA